VTTVYLQKAEDSREKTLKTYEIAYASGTHFLMED
jgi:hypothetical protein